MNIKPIKLGLLAAALAGSAALAQAQTAFNLTALSYSQNFDTLSPTAATTLSTTLTGWSAWDTDTTNAAITSLAPDTGSNNAGGVRNFGSTLSTDRAIGSLASTSALPAYGVLFQNNTGSTLTGVSISYVSELWRSGSNTLTETVSFQYLISDSAVSLTSVAQTWTSASSLTMTELNPTLTNNTAINGNTTGNFTSVAGSILFNLNPGQYVAFRFLDADNTGADAVMAVDDFQANFSAIPEPSTYAAIFGGVALVGTMVARRRKTTVSTVDSAA